jgi:putative endonuclease
MIYYVYIISNKKQGVLYVGVTNNLIERIWQHKESKVEGFSSKYKLKKLVHYEEYSEICDAITREKRLKKWKRDWKIELIEKNNKEWKDLYLEL